MYRFNQRLSKQCFTPNYLIKDSLIETKVINVQIMVPIISHVSIYSKINDFCLIFQVKIVNRSKLDLQEMFCAKLKRFKFYWIFCKFQHIFLLIILHLAVSNTMVFNNSIE